MINQRSLVAALLCATSIFGGNAVAENSELPIGTWTVIGGEQGNTITFEKGGVLQLRSKILPPQSKLLLQNMRSLSAADREYIVDNKDGTITVITKGEWVRSSPNRIGVTVIDHETQRKSPKIEFTVDIKGGKLTAPDGSRLVKSNPLLPK